MTIDSDGNGKSSEREVDKRSGARDNWMNSREAAAEFGVDIDEDEEDEDGDG